MRLSISCSVPSRTNGACACGLTGRASSTLSTRLMRSLASPFRSCRFATGTRAHTLSYTNSLYSTLSLSLTHSHSLSLSLTLSVSLSLSLSLSHTHTHTHTHKPVCYRYQGSLVRVARFLSPVRGLKEHHASCVMLLRTKTSLLRVARFFLSLQVTAGSALLVP